MRSRTRVPPARSQYKCANAMSLNEVGKEHERVKDNTKMKTGRKDIHGYSNVVTKFVKAVASNILILNGNPLMGRQFIYNGLTSKLQFIFRKILVSPCTI